MTTCSDTLIEEREARYGWVGIAWKIDMIERCGQREFEPASAIRSAIR